MTHENEDGSVTITVGNYSATLKKLGNGILESKDFELPDGTEQASTEYKCFRAAVEGAFNALIGALVS